MKKLVATLAIATMSIMTDMQSVQGMYYMPNKQQNKSSNASDLDSLYAEYKESILDTKAHPGINSLTKEELKRAEEAIDLVCNDIKSKGLAPQQIAARVLKMAYYKFFLTTVYDISPASQFLEDVRLKSTFWAVRADNPAVLTTEQIIGGLEEVKNLLDTVKTSSVFLQRYSNSTGTKLLVNEMPEECQQRLDQATAYMDEVGSNFANEQFCKQISKWMIIERFALQEVSTILSKEAITIAGQKGWLNDQIISDINTWRVDGGKGVMPDRLKQVLERNVEPPTDMQSNQGMSYASNEQQNSGSNNFVHKIKTIGFIAAKRIATEKGEDSVDVALSNKLSANEFLNFESDIAYFTLKNQSATTDFGVFKPEETLGELKLLFNFFNTIALCCNFLKRYSKDSELKTFIDELSLACREEFVQYKILGKGISRPGLEKKIEETNAQEAMKDGAISVKYQVIAKKSISNCLLNRCCKLNVALHNEYKTWESGYNGEEDKLEVIKQLLGQ